MSGIMSNMQSMFGKIGSTLQKGTDMILSSETRAAVSAKLKEFAINNPKIAVRSQLDNSHNLPTICSVDR